MSQIPLRAVTHVALPPRESDLVETLIGIRTSIYMACSHPQHTFTCFAFSFISSPHSLEGDDTFALLQNIQTAYITQYEKASRGLPVGAVSKKPANAGDMGSLLGSE